MLRESPVNAFKAMHYGKGYRLLPSADFRKETMKYTVHLIKSDGTPASMSATAPSEDALRKALKSKGYVVAGITERCQDQQDGALASLASPMIPPLAVATKIPEPMSAPAECAKSSGGVVRRQPRGESCHFPNKTAPPPQHVANATGLSGAAKVLLASIGGLVLCWLCSVTILAPDTKRNAELRDEFATWATEEAVRRYMALINFERDDRGDLTERGGQQMLLMSSPTPPTMASIRDMILLDGERSLPYYHVIDRFITGGYGFMSMLLRPILWGSLIGGVIALIIVFRRGLWAS